MFSWTLHQKGSPKEGSHAAVAVRHKLYYFGWNNDENNEDPICVHVFNTVTLLWLPPVSPGSGEPHLEFLSWRRSHTAVLIEDIVYLWGVCELFKYCNLLHAFDVDTHAWFKPQVSGTVPDGRTYHSACVLGKIMYIHGGITQLTRLTNDIYKLDTNTMVWALINTRGTAAPASCRHSATIIGTKMFVFGGCGRYREYRLGQYRWGQYRLGQSYNTIRVFDTETNSWMSTPSPQPLPKGRLGHSAFTYNGELYIFGGLLSNGSFLNDVWRFSPGSFSWKKVEPKGEGPSPTSRMCCCMVGDRIILFGGINTCDDLYALDLSPGLKTLCKLAVIQYGLEQFELPHNIRWELAAMTSNNN